MDACITGGELTCYTGIAALNFIFYKVSKSFTFFYFKDLGYKSLSVTDL